MPLLGAHVSTAGGVDNAPRNGKNLGCEAIQLFTRNQMQWQARPLSKQAIAAFRETVEECGIRAAVSHDSYLINLGSDDPVTLQRSLDAFADEIDRCEQLGISSLVFHPGSHVGAGEVAGLQRIADNLNRVLQRKPNYRTQLLLENTAGQGSNLGYRFEHLAEVLARSQYPERLGVCLDTCHLHAAGYDLRSRSTYEAVMRDCDVAVGLDRVKAFHLNDSKRGLGSRVDRHENIGKGELGLEPFRFLLNDPRFAEHPMLLETPGGDKAYRRDLKTLRRLKP
ncbi:MAG: deoxyribonuclease IV [Acidimicrobiia bacterium]|nr:deoxyribonuclease IV [Acidimicrobiia bacterium]